jgi:DNA-binding NarL/FixJ family response regulator
MGSDVKLSSRAEAILEMIARGYSYERILAEHKELTYLDLFAAAREVLDVIKTDQAGLEKPAGVKGKPARAGKKWDEAEDKRLAELFRAGEPVARIAELLERREFAIQARLVKSGLLKSKDVPGYRELVERKRKKDDPEAGSALR